mmetsp:Transcript_49435/g.107757  ORF Transcript_49435/g.107757 Transcript_49435/m.107757 type:complete len:257 (-) Transcript_49435:498-1268(-)
MLMDRQLPAVSQDKPTEELPQLLQGKGAQTTSAVGFDLDAVVQMIRKDLVSQPMAVFGGELQQGHQTTEVGGHEVDIRFHQTGPVKAMLRLLHFRHMQHHVAHFGQEIAVGIETRLRTTRGVIHHHCVFVCWIQAHFCFCGQIHHLATPDLLGRILRAHEEDAQIAVRQRCQCHFCYVFEIPRPQRWHDAKQPWQCFGNFWFQICFFWALVSQQQLLPVTQLSSSLKVRQLRVVHSSTESIQIRHPFGAELQEILW